MAQRRARAPAVRAAPGARARLSPGTFLRGDRRDHELPGQYGEDAHVPRAQEIEAAAAGARRHTLGVARMSDAATPSRTHPIMWELIPWFVNGRLGAAE